MWRLAVALSPKPAGVLVWVGSADYDTGIWTSPSRD